MQQAGVDLEPADRYPAEQVLLDVPVRVSPLTEKNSATA